METKFLIIISFVVVLLLIFMFFFIKPVRRLLKFNESWYELLLHKSQMTYVNYVFNKLNMLILGLPVRFMFKQYAKLEESGFTSNFSTLKNTYIYVASSIAKDITLHRKRYILDSLNLFRIGSHYIITGDISKIFQIIQKVHKINKSSLLQTQLRKDFDIIRYNEIAELINTMIEEILISFDSYPIDTSDSIVNSKNQNEREILISYVIDDIRNRIKSKQAYLIDEVEVNYSKVKILKNLIDKNDADSKKEIVTQKHKKVFLDLIIFEKLVSSHIKAKQAGLKLELSDLASYFGMSGDFERIVDVLIKTKQFNFKEEVGEIEKYIHVDYNIEETIANLIRARKVNADISLKDLEEHISLGGDVVVFVNSIVRAHYGQVVVSPNDLNKYFSNGGNVQKLISALIKLKKEDIDISFEDLSAIRLEGGNVEQIIDDIVKAKHVGLSINLNDIKYYLSQDIDSHQLVDILIKNATSELNIDIEDLKNLARINVDLDMFYKSLSLDKKEELGIEKEKLMKLQIAGIDMFNYVMALKINRDNDLRINPSELEIDFLEKRNVLPILLSVVRTKNTDNQLSYKFGIVLDKLGHDVAKDVDWALNPQVITMELKPIVTKNAFSIKPTVNVMVRGKIKKIITGARNDVLKDRVNEAFISEIELVDSYESVLHSLNEISNRVLRRLNAQMDKEDYKYYESIDEKEIKHNNDRENMSNQSSAYEILDVNIQNVEVGTDILAKLKKEMAELKHTISASKSLERQQLAIAQAAETKAKLIESEAELKKGIAEAFRKGSLHSTNEYHKYKIIHEDEEYTVEHSPYDLHTKNTHQNDDNEQNELREEQGLNEEN